MTFKARASCVAQVLRPVSDVQARDGDENGQPAGAHASWSRPRKGSSKPKKRAFRCREGPKRSGKHTPYASGMEFFEKSVRGYG